MTHESAKFVFFQRTPTKEEATKKMYAQIKEKLSLAM